MRILGWDQFAMFATSVEEAERLVEPFDCDFLDEMRNQYPQIRQCSPAILKTLRVPGFAAERFSAEGDSSYFGRCTAAFQAITRSPHPMFHVAQRVYLAGGEMESLAAGAAVTHLGPGAMSRADVWYMVRRRAADWGIETAIGCNMFRPTGITDYLTNGGRIEVAQRMAGHLRVDCIIGRHGLLTPRRFCASGRGYGRPQPSARRSAPP